MSDIWNAETYSQFLDVRTRPARDLLAAIPTSLLPKIVYDLGCGPGNSTILLKNRWPEATVIGIDSSSDMLDEAKKSYPEIKFLQADIANFNPQEKIDCLFANASLQWLDQHEILFPKLLSSINVGGAFAFQMPNNFHNATHQVIIHVLESKSNWQPLIKKLFYGKLTSPHFNISWYYDVLTQAGAKNLQLWETTYFQEMTDHQKILEWVKGTVLRPILSAMDVESQSQFAKNYLTEIVKHYSVQVNNKILLPFTRMFMVGIKK